MAILTRTLTALLLSSAAVAQTLNPWPARVFTNHDEFTDGDASTFAVETVPTHDYFLFNSWQNLAGFYVQSSGCDFATDYYVTATIDWPLTRLITIGQVCGATSNFTLVRFADNHGNDYVRSDSYFLQVTGAKGNASAVRINEVWPIFVGDEIVDPENAGPCPAEPSATATPTVRRRRALADAA
ncbi:hypothetical protein GE09DRAFT_1055888 [Coniochaeta sp. 2T2.1]|nr:hypothetical protein GE09DRAFT_1055888 [Coniochaeta sp. 2T2.1]